MDEPPVDPPSLAVYPDETPDPRLLPAWMRMLAPKPARHRPAQLERQAEAGDDLADALDLPSSLAALPEVPPLPLRKALPMAEQALVDGPAPEVVDAPLPDEPGEVVLDRLPAWMRGAPEHGPPDEPESQAAVGAAQDDSAEWLPE